MCLTAETPTRFPDNFCGDNAKLIACIRALLELDAKNALRPHGIGALARGLLSAAMHRLAAPEAERAEGEAPDNDWRLRGYAYASKQATNCAQCGEYKHTPLRIDAMGGYVCLTCIDRKLGALLGEFGYPAEPPPAGQPDGGEK